MMQRIYTHRRLQRILWMGETLVEKSELGKKKKKKQKRLTSQ